MNSGIMPFTPESRIKFNGVMTIRGVRRHVNKMNLKRERAMSALARSIGNTYGIGIRSFLTQPKYSFMLQNMLRNSKGSQAQISTERKKREALEVGILI